MPGESVSAYRRHVENVVHALAPENDADAQSVMIIADVQWRLGRWLRVEHSEQLLHLESDVRVQASIRHVYELKNAVAGVSKLIEVHREIESPRAEVLGSFIAGCRALVSELSRLEITLDGASKLAQALEEFPSGPNSETRAAYARVGVLAVRLAQELTELVAPAEQRLDAIRAELAALTTLDEKTMKRLSRYHSMLSKAMDEELELLAKLRALTRRRRRKSTSSFGTEKLRLRKVLRVVK